MGNYWLKIIGANQAELLDIYIKQIRSVLEFTAVVWHAGLTIENTYNIERVQKSALTIILGKSYRSYEDALLLTGLDRLSTRRITLCAQFAKKAAQNPRHKSWVVANQNETQTRRRPKLFKEALTRTNRLERSTLPYFTNLLNLSSDRTN